MRGSYWSSSTFADWVRKTFADVVKPTYATATEWRDWKVQFRESSPLVYKFTEQFLNDVQDFFVKPYDIARDVKYWLYNALVSQPHKINTRLKVGKYHEVNDRMLHGMFELLVDFIEIEKAWMHVVWDDEARKAYNLPWYKRVPYLLRWKQWRSAEAGIAHLQWEISLTDSSLDGEGLPTHQATSAREQYALYDWWKNVRPNRPDVMDASGWSEYCRLLEEKHGEDWVIMHDDSLDGLAKEAHATMNKMEQLYEKEDEEMLTRLVRTRLDLWT